MAEIDRLTIDITLSDGFESLERKGAKAAKSLNDSYSELDNTFVLLAKDVSEFSQAFEQLNNRKLTLNDSLIKVASTIGESYDLAVEFGQSLDGVLEKLNSVKGTTDNINDPALKSPSELPDFKPLYTILSQIAQFYYDNEEFLKIFLTYLDVFKVYASVYFHELVKKSSEIYNVTRNIAQVRFDQFVNFIDQLKVAGNAGYQRFLEFYNIAKEFGKVRFNNFISFSKEIVGKGFKDFGLFLSRNSKEIAKFLASTFIVRAALLELSYLIGGLAALTVPELLFIAGVLIITYLAVTGRFNDLGRMVEDVFKNRIIPWFGSANQSADELRKGIESTGDAIKDLDSVQAGPVLSSDLKTDAALTFHKTFGIDENAFGIINLESAARSIATNMASGADSFSKINEELTQRGFLELFDGIKSGRPLFIDVLNADTVEEKKTVARKLSEQLQYISADREKAEREEIQKTVQAAKDAGAEQISVSQDVANNQSEFSRVSTDEVKNNLGEVKKEIENLPAVDYKEVLPGITVPIEKTQEEVEELGQTFEKTSNTAQGSLDELGVFAADIAAEINDTFADLIFRSFKGDFDNMKDFWKSTLDAMLNTFAQFAATIISNPIRILLDAVLRGDGGAGNSDGGGGGGGKGKGGVKEGGDILGGIGAFFGKGFGSFKALFSGATWAGSLSSIVSTVTSALSFVGAIVAAAFTVFSIVTSFLKKTPRLDIDFDSVKTEVGRRAALVEEFLDPEFFMENIGQVSVKRGGVGVGAGGSNQILELIRERIEETIEGIQDIIAKLPTDLFNQLNETLLNAEIDIDTVIAGERLLEFDAKGKKIGEKFQQFIEGELPAKFFAAIRESFFEPAFLALGVSAEGTEALIDKFMADMEAAGSREARAEVGAEFIATFNAFVDAFNIVSGNVNDSIGQTIQSVNNLSAKLGFDAVPSIDELRKTLGEMIENAEIDAETVQAYADLRNAIVSLMSEITSAITGLIGKINQLNTTIVSLGGSAVDTTGFLNTAATQLQDFLGANMGNLSLSEQEGFLDQLLGIANDMLAQEQAAFAEAQQAAREAAEKAAEAQRAAVQQRIDGLNAEKERIEETFNARIEALNEELRIAEGFAQLTESIRRTLDSILYSPESVLTGVEQVNALQTNVAALQQELAGTTDPERQMEIAGQLEEAFKTLFGAAGDAFGVNSPEYVAIFDQVTGGLSGLAEMTESRARTVEEINAEIERLTAEQNSRLDSIDAKIEAAQEQLSAIGTQEVEATFQASDRVKELFEYIRTEYMRILEERFAQLEEASVTGFATELEGLQAIAGTSEESLVTLKEQMAEAVTQTGQLTKIADLLGALNGYDGGSGGLKDFGRGTLAVLHGKEAVVTEAQVRAMKKHMALAAEMTGGLGGALGGALETFAESIEGTGPVGRLGRELVGAGRLTELADRIGTARITSMMEEFAGTSAAGGGLVERLAEKLSGEDGHITGLARRAAVEEVKNEMSVAISVNVNGGSGATVASIGNEIENMLVRSIKQGGKLRSAIQDAGAKRMG